MHDQFSTAQLEQEIGGLRAELDVLRVFFEDFLGVAYQWELPGFKPLLFQGTVRELTGYDQADFIHGNVGWDRLVHPDDRSQFNANLEKVIGLPGYVADHEYRIVNRFGLTRWVRDVGRKVQDQGAQPLIRGFIYDVTERKDAEDLVAPSLSLLRATLESTADGILVVDRDGKVASFNAKFVELWQVPEALAASRDDRALLGYVLGQLVSPDEFINRVDQLYEHPEQESWEVIHFKDGKIFERYSKPQWIGGGVVGRVWSFRDVTQRLRAEQGLADEKERLAVTLRSIGDGVITTDVNGRVTMINRAAEDLTGWTQTEAAGKPLAEVFNIVNETSRLPVTSPVERVLSSGLVVGLANHTALISRDGTERAIADSGAPISDRQGHVIGVVLVFRDVSEKLKLETEFARAEKLDSLGILAGGIAHDFNNILTAIMGNISLARSLPLSEADLKLRLAEMENACLRARDLTRQLLTFSRGGAPIKTTASIAEIIAESISFVLHGSNVRPEFILPPELWPVEIDPGQINQVIHNLALNAVQAMPGGGVLTITGENLAPGSTPAIIAPGHYVRIDVIDRGMGIPPENLAKIFDPYFSTKEGGSGLGLATSYSIVNRHDGLLTVESKPGAGSVFHVYLPAAQSRQAQAPDGSEPCLQGRGRVLVMDDDPGVREVVKAMLQALGYEAVCACDGQAALEIYQRAADESRPFDAVILDLTVPGGMGGRETIAALKTIDPHVKAIVSSGYSSDPIMSEYRAHGFAGVALKPYRLHELSQVLHQAMDTDPN
jgi:PAS domain S-box-containing protein